MSPAWPCSAAARAIWRRCATACATAAAAPSCCEAASGARRPARQSGGNRQLAVGLRRRPCRGELTRGAGRTICRSTRRDGGFVRHGFRAELDAARWPARRQPQGDGRAGGPATSSETGIKSLQACSHNNILGFYRRGAGRLSQASLERAAGADASGTSQTMAGAVRFTTAGADGDREPHRRSRRARARASSRRCSPNSATAIGASTSRSGELAAALAELDCEAGLAQVAAEQGYTRPALDDSTTFEIRGGAPSGGRAGAEGGQRPGVHRERLRAGRRRAPAMPPMASTRSTEARLWLVTGPNMAGKSTFLRQNALDCRAGADGLVRAGALGAHRHRRSPVLARRCRRRPARAGARPSWSRWLRRPPSSTRPPTRSLVILDEIGRGTATFDGLSIAWAVVEYLHEVNQLPSDCLPPTTTS